MVKKQMIIFYGAHHVSCLKDFLPLVKKELKSLRKVTQDFFYVIENGGPYPQQINELMEILPDKDEKEIFNIFIEIADKAYRGYLSTKKKTYSEIVNNENINLSLPEFDYKLIDFALKNKLRIIREEPKYDDFKKYKNCYPPIPFHVVSQIQNEFYQEYDRKPMTRYMYWDNFFQKRVFEKLIENLRLRETTFIESMKKTVHENPNHSFIIIRGSLHKKYFQDIKKVFEKGFNIKKIEYGVQVEDRFPTI